MGEALQNANESISTANRGGYAQRNSGKMLLTQLPAHNRVDRAAADDGYVGDEDGAGELEERLEGDVWR